MSSATAHVSAEAAPRTQAAGVAQTYAYFAAFVALGLTTGSLGPTLPGLAGQTHTSLGLISFLFTARSLGFMLGSFQGGKWLDRFSGNRLMACAATLMALAMAALPLLPLLWLLTLLMLLLGAAEGALDVGGNTLVVRLHGERVGPYMNGLHFFFGVGAFLAPVIIAWTVTGAGEVAQAYWALALLLLPAIVWLALQPNTLARPAAREIQAAHVDVRLVLLIALFLFLYLGAEVGFGGWVYTYAVGRGVGGATAAAYLTSAFWGSLTLGRLFSIPLAARFRPRSILLFDLAGCLASLCLILLWPDSLTAVLIGTISLGLSMASIFPATLALAGRHLNVTGRVTSWFLVGASAGSMSVPWLIGQLFERAGPRSAMVVILFDLVGAAIIYVTLIRRLAKS